MSCGVFDFNKSLYTRAPSAISKFRARENKRESAAWVNVIWRFNAPSTLACKVYARSISAQPSVRDAVTCYRRSEVAMQSVSGTIVNLSSPFFLQFQSESILEYQSFNQSRRSIHAMKKRSIQQSDDVSGSSCLQRDDDLFTSDLTCVILND